MKKIPPLFILLLLTTFGLFGCTRPQYRVVTESVPAAKEPTLGMMSTQAATHSVAHQGKGDAQFKLGDMYYHKRDYKQALSLYHSAAGKGNALAQNQLGWMSENGEGVSQSYKEAVAWYRKAAEQGNTTAQTRLGNLYFEGKGVPKNYQEAFKWLRKAAEQGNVMAQNQLGWMYENGKGVSQNHHSALAWYRKAADNGNAISQARLGNLYFQELGVPKNNQEAFKWFRKAAEQGNAIGQAHLGLMYQEGLTVSKNHQTAANLYRKAAEQGNALAQANLGLMYETGLGVSQDDDEAVRWYRKAAEQGNTLAQNNLNQLQAEIQEKQRYISTVVDSDSISQSEMSRQLAECMLPYFATGLKWNLSHLEQQRMTDLFAEKLPDLVNFDRALTEETAVEICSQYGDLRVPREMSNRAFSSAMREYGVGEILDYLEGIKNE